MNRENPAPQHPDKNLSEIDKLKLGIEDAIESLDGIISTMQGSQEIIKSWIEMKNGNK